MFKKLLILFWMTESLAFSAPIITPSSTSTFVGGTVQFTSTDTVTWSLTAGSTGTISAGGLYTAPRSFAAKNVVAGCPALPNDHVYNTRIDNLPVDANSTTRINNIVTSPLQFEPSFPLNVLSNATPTTTMTFFYTTLNNGLAFPALSFPYAGVESAATPTDYFAQDRHQLGVNTDTCQFIEMYNKYPTGTNVGCPTCNAQSGIKYSAMSYVLADARTGGGTTDAGGLFIEPLALRYSELKAGSVKHALRFTLSNGYIQPAFIWPATSNAAVSCSPSSTCFPYGARLRLKSSFNISGYSPTAQVVLTALKQYGMFLADGGATPHIQTITDVVEDTTTWKALESEIPVISTISPNNFEQVDESTLVESTFTGHVNLSNAFVTPDNFAQVVATKNSDSSTATVNVALQPVTVGFKNLPYPPNSAALSVMAGTPQFQIPFWVNGATNTATSCTMSPSFGTLTSGCLYTAPASQTLLSSMTVTITPTNSDSSQTLSFPLVIFPSDAIRMRAGPNSAANSPPPSYDAFGNYGPDANGKYWWDDPVGSQLPWYSRDDNYSPQSSWPSTPDIGLFYTAMHGNSDGVYGMMVPNGAYTLSLGFGASPGNFNVANSSVSIDSQGGTLLSTASVLQSNYVPVTLTYPVTVTNNQFYFAIRQVVSTMFTTISKWSLTPVPPIPPVPPSELWSGKVSIKGTATLK